jgi:cell shape-determining protein MreC
MVRKHTRVANRWLFTWFILTGFIFLFLPENTTGRFQLGFVRVFRWPLSLGGSVALTAQTQQSLTDTVPRREYDKLIAYSANLKETLDQQRSKFEQLYGLYNHYVWQGADFVVADVTTATVNGSQGELIIDCRRNAGLAKGQYVLGDNSVIGTISDISSDAASVRLFTDPGSVIPVKVGQVSTPTVMKGCGQNLAKIRMLKLSKQVEAGEYVFALRQAGFLDAPVVIGKVVKCERNRDRSATVWDVTVEPACDIKKLEDVAVIIMNPQK